MDNDFLAIPATPNTTNSSSPVLPSIKSSSPPPMTSEGEDIAAEASTTSLLGDVGGGQSGANNNTDGGGVAMAIDVNGLEEESLQERAPSIDHALLETIFYNEMIAMGDSFSLEGASVTSPPAGGGAASVGTVDSSVGGIEGTNAAASHHSAAVEGGNSKVGGGDELFQDLDALTRSALPSPPPPSLPPTEISMGGLQQQQPSPAVWTQQQQQMSATPGSSQVVQQQQMVPVSTPVTAPPAVVATPAVAQPQQPAATAPVSSTSLPAPAHPQQTETHRAVSFVLPQPAPVITTTTAPAAAPPPPPVVSTAVPSPTSVAAATTVTQPQPQQQNQQTQQKAKQLVSQFASLAGRLGISLPPSVLNSLTAAAVINESKQVSSDPATPDNGAVVTTTAPATSAPASQQSAAAKTPATKAKSKRTPKSKTAAAAPSAISVADATTSTAATPVNTTVQRLKDTAAEAVAAIDENRRKRNSPDTDNGNNATESQSPTNANNNETNETDGGTKTATTNTHTSNRPTQYRRRKKPRLQDCETKLAMLRAENATLKRHLEKFANKSQNFDLERQRAEQNMKYMIENGEQNPEKLKGVLDKFTEMYSDYGQHREEELDFHLNQLERLAAPTTITKMSLWTLGQDHQFFRHPQRNPIAGILMKELAITPVQARKIIEHRHRIRDLCDNIKQCMALIKRLKSLCKHKQKIFNDRMTKCQEILTPLQVVKLLHWIDEHSGTLESVCPGWGSERIRAGNKAAIGTGNSSISGAGAGTTTGDALKAPKHSTGGHGTGQKNENVTSQNHTNS